MDSSTGFPRHVRGALMMRTNILISGRSSDEAHDQRVVIIIVATFGAIGLVTLVVVVVLLLIRRCSSRARITDVEEALTEEPIPLQDLPSPGNRRSVYRKCNFSFH